MVLIPKFRQQYFDMKHVIRRVADFSSLLGIAEMVFQKLISTPPESIGAWVTGFVTNSFTSIFSMRISYTHGKYHFFRCEWVKQCLELWWHIA